MPIKLPRPPVKPIVDLAKRVVPVICPNPNITATLLPRPQITFGCR